MGWCHEFGVEIEERCSHPMTAGATACSCSECGTVCRGRFERGCEAVWRRGPRNDAPERPSRGALVSLPLAGVNGSLNGGLRVAAALPDTKVNGVGGEDDPSRRIQDLHATLANLAEEVAYQSRHLAALGEHLEGLDKVVGQLTDEANDRLNRLEQQARTRLRGSARLGSQAPRR